MNINIKEGYYFSVATSDGISVGLVIKVLPIEGKIRYFSDNKNYDSMSIQSVKGRIKRNEAWFGCYQHQVYETDISNIKEILGNVPKRRFQRIMTTKTVF